MAIRLLILMTTLVLLSCKMPKSMLLEYISTECTDKHFLHRAFLNDSVFVNNHIWVIAQKDTFCLADTFKIVNKRWYYYWCTGFVPYLDHTDFENGKVTKLRGANCSNVHFSYLPLVVDTINKRIVYVYQYRSQHTLYEDPVIWFDPVIGKVKSNSKGMSRCTGEYLNINKNQMRHLKRFYKKSGRRNGQ